MFWNGFGYPERIHVRDQFLNLPFPDDKDKDGSDSEEFIDELDPTREPCPKPIDDEYNIALDDEQDYRRRLPPGYDLKNELFGHHKICGWLPFDHFEQSQQTGSGSLPKNQELVPDRFASQASHLQQLQVPISQKKKINKVLAFVKRHWDP